MTKICPDCDATVHSTSQPNRMGTTPAQEDMYERFDVDDDYAYRFQYADGSAFQIYADGRAYIMDKDGSIRDKPKGVVTNRIPLLIGMVAKPRQDRIEELEAQIAALAATPAVGGEPAAWLYEMSFYIKPSDNPPLKNWKQVVTITPPPAIPEGGVRNVLPLYAAQPASPLRGMDSYNRETLVRVLARKFPETFTPYGNRQAPNALAFNVVDAFLDSASPPEQPELRGRDLDIPITIDGYDPITMRDIIVAYFIADKRPFDGLGKRCADRYLAAIASPPEQLAADPVTGRLSLGDMVCVNERAPFFFDWRNATLKVVSLRVDPEGKQWVSVIEGEQRHRGNGVYDGETTDFEGEYLSPTVPNKEAK